MADTKNDGTEDSLNGKNLLYLHHFDIYFLFIGRIGHDQTGCLGVSNVYLSQNDTKRGGWGGAKAMNNFH